MPTASSPASTASPKPAARRHTCALTTGQSSSPSPWPTGAGSRRPPACSSTPAHRGRTGSSRASTGAFATSCSTGSASSPSSRPRCCSRTGGSTTTSTVLTRLTAGSVRSRSSRRGPTSKSYCSHSGWLRNRVPVSPTTPLHNVANNDVTGGQHGRRGGDRRDPFTDHATEGPSGRRHRHRSDLGRPGRGQLRQQSGGGLRAHETDLHPFGPALRHLPPRRVLQSVLRRDIDARRVRLLSRLLISSDARVRTVDPERTELRTHEMPTVPVPRRTARCCPFTSCGAPRATVG